MAGRVKMIWGGAHRLYNAPPQTVRWDSGINAALDDLDDDGFSRDVSRATEAGQFLAGGRVVRETTPEVKLCIKMIKQALIDLSSTDYSIRLDAKRWLWGKLNEDTDWFLSCDNCCAVVGVSRPVILGFAKRVLEVGRIVLGNQV